MRVLPIDGPPRVIELTGQSFQIGREPACELPMGDDVAHAVSRRHACIAEEGDAPVLFDLGSTNGTFLNDVQVIGKTRIEVGSRIRLGNVGPRIEVLAIAWNGRQPDSGDRVNSAAPLQAPQVQPVPAAPTPDSVVQAQPPPTTAPVRSTREILADFIRAQTARNHWSGVRAFAVAFLGLGFMVVALWLRSGLNEEQHQTELVKRVRQSVVHIETDKGQGSGFVLDARGIIVTNYHVVHGAQQASVLFADGTRSNAGGFLAAAPGKDLVLLSVVPHEGFPPPLPLTKTASVQGQRVLAFGSPYGMRGSVTEGIVSRVIKGRDLRLELDNEPGRIPWLPGVSLYRNVLGLDDDVVWIQTDVTMKPGNSGGPLVDLHGCVVGVNSVTLKELPYSISAETLAQVAHSTDGGVRPLAELPRRTYP